MTAHLAALVLAMTAAPARVASQGNDFALAPLPDLSADLPGFTATDAPTEHIAAGVVGEAWAPSGPAVLPPGWTSVTRRPSPYAGTDYSSSQFAYSPNYALPWQMMPGATAEIQRRAARPEFLIPYQRHRVYGKSVIDMKYGEHDPALSKKAVGSYLDETKRIEAQEAAYAQSVATPDLTATTARPYLRSLPASVGADKVATAFIEMGGSLQGHERDHLRSKKRVNAWRQAHGNTRLKSKASSHVHVGTPADGVASKSGRNPFYVLHGGYDSPSRANDAEKQGRHGTTATDVPSVGRFQEAGALLEAASQRSEQGLAQMLGQEANAAASAVAASSKPAGLPPQAQPRQRQRPVSAQWLSMSASGGQPAQNIVPQHALQQASLTRLPPLQPNMSPTQPAMAAPGLPVDGGGLGAMRFRGSIASQVAGTLQNGAPQFGAAGSAGGSLLSSAAAPVIQRVLQPIIIQQPVPQMQQLQQQPQMQRLQQQQQQPQIIILQQPPLQQSSSTAAMQAGQRPRDR